MLEQIGIAAPSKTTLMNLVKKWTTLKQAVTAASKLPTAYELALAPLVTDVVAKLPAASEKVSAKLQAVVKAHPNTFIDMPEDITNNLDNAVLKLIGVAKIVGKLTDKDCKLFDPSEQHLHKHLVTLTQLDGVDLTACAELSTGFADKVEMATKAGGCAVTKFAKGCWESWERALMLFKKYSPATAAGENWDLESVTWMFDESNKEPEQEIGELKSLFLALPDKKKWAEKFAPIMNFDNNCRNEEIASALEVMNRFQKEFLQEIVDDMGKLLGTVMVMSGHVHITGLFVYPWSPWYP